MIAAQPIPARVLVADNSVASRGVLTILLENAGYDVINVNDGRNAMEALRAHAFDLAILDHEMPNLDDLGALIELRTALPRLPVIICAQTLTEEQAARYRELGVVELLAKPVEPHALRSKANELLARHRPQTTATGQRPPPFRTVHGTAGDPALCPLASGPSRYARKLQTDLQRLRDFRTVAVLQGRVGSGRFELALALSPATHAHTFVCHSDDLTPARLDQLFKPAATTAHPVFLVALDADRLAPSGQAYLEDLLSGRITEHVALSKRLRLVLTTQSALCDLHFSELLLMRAVTATVVLPDFVDRWMDWADIACTILRRAGSGRNEFDPEALRWIDRHLWKGDYMQLHRTVELARRLAGVSPIVLPAHLEHAVAAEPGFNEPLFHDLLFHVHSGD